MTVLFYQFFKTLQERGATVTVELKNDVCMQGRLAEVDQFLNVKLADVSVSDPEKFPQLMALKSCFIRGSVLRYVHLNPADVDAEQLQEDSRKEALDTKKEIVEKMMPKAAA
eukprot:gene416-131_t